MERTQVAHADLSREYAGPGGGPATQRDHNQVPLRRADSYREQLQVHPANGRDHALRVRIQAGKNLVRPAEVVRTASGARLIGESFRKISLNRPELRWNYRLDAEVRSGLDKCSTR